jgi:Leucine-rich repeat (LRR) protein
MSQIVNTTSTISFSGQHISELPENLWNNVSLETLNLSDTNISILPENICRLTSLKNLNLRGCPIIEIPDYAGNLPNLTYLDISKTKVKNISKHVLYTKALKKLIVLDNIVFPIQEVKKLLAMYEDNVLFDDSTAGMIDIMHNMLKRNKTEVHIPSILSMENNSIMYVENLKIVFRGINNGQGDKYKYDDVIGISRDKHSGKEVFWELDY